MYKISIIGAGKIGTSLAVLLKKAGYTIAGVSSRKTESCERFMKEVKQGKVCSSNSEAARVGEMVFITTNDDAIEEVCKEVAPELDGKIVVHCSGALTTDALDSAQGARRAAIHPMQTVPCVDKGIKSLPGSYFDIECDDELYPALEKVVRDIGGMPVRITKQGKVFNHVASCMVSCFSVALFSIALKLYQDMDLGPDQAAEMLLPLLQESTANVKKVGSIKALTGPVERGDIDTIRRHLNALDKVKWIKALYICLSRSTLKIAEQKGLEKDRADEIKSLLKSHIVG